MFVFHPWLGWAATAGGTLLIAATVLHQRATRHSAIEAAGAAQRAEILSEQLRTKADQVRSLAMADTGYARWVALRSDAQSRALAVSDVSGMFTAFSRTLRLFLQSAILAIGALLVLNGELAPGAMIVASILMGRALAPIDQAISGWPIVQRAQEGWRRIEGLLAAAPVQPHRIALPRGRGSCRGPTAHDHPARTDAGDLADGFVSAGAWSGTRHHRRIGRRQVDRRTRRHRPVAAGRRLDTPRRRIARPVRA